MAFLVADRVKESTTTTGTGTLTLGGAVTGFQTFAAIGNGNTSACCCYAVNAAGNPTGEWEVFIGTYTASGTTLARTTVLSSSNGGSAVNFSAGTKHVVVSLAALLSMVDSSQNIQLPSGKYIGSSGGARIDLYSNGVFECRGGNGVTMLIGGILSAQVRTNGSLGFATNPLAAANDVEFQRIAAKVIGVYGASSVGAWLQNTAGLSRVTSDVTNTTTTPANITGLTSTLIAGRKYTGKLVLFASDATAADGLKLDFDGGTATMTSFQAAVTGNTQGATAGTTVSAAIATDLNFTALNGTGVNCIEVQIAFVCNAAGTFIPRIAKDSDAAGATLTIAANSFMELQDAP